MILNHYWDTDTWRKTLHNAEINVQMFPSPLVVQSVFFFCKGSSLFLSCIIVKKNWFKFEPLRAEPCLFALYQRRAESCWYCSHAFWPCSWRHWHRLLGIKWQHSRSVFVCFVLCAFVFCCCCLVFCLVVAVLFLFLVLFVCLFVLATFKRWFLTKGRKIKWTTTVLSFLCLKLCTGQESPTERREVIPKQWFHFHFPHTMPCRQA